MVFTSSSLTEQTTPAFFALSDSSSQVLSINFTVTWQILAELCRVNVRSDFLTDSLDRFLVLESETIETRSAAFGRIWTWTSATWEEKWRGSLPSTLPRQGTQRARRCKGVEDTIYIAFLSTNRVTDFHVTSRQM